MITKAARRYTTALYDVAQEQDKLNGVTTDIEKILGLINSNRDLELFFKSPIVSKSKKLALINEIFSGNISRLTLDFMILLVNRRREFLLQGLFEDFLNLRKEKEGIVDVLVKTSIPLSDEEKQSMKMKIDSYTRLKGNMRYEIDKSIIGGFVAKINDTILDASIKRQLERLKDKFKEGDFSLN
ncbi:MAG TPA: ATP synthase F1 subunit delta [Ignavibacteria bacterium]|nr:ATP synthase F1 subunit delta [Ignavibacteria bacterium]HMR39023.1 ATP synthase F1 subunit delta [Ignavibacteria bacterium]